MFRIKVALLALLLCATLTGWGMSQFKDKVKLDGPAPEKPKPPVKSPEKDLAAIEEFDSYKDDLKTIREAGQKDNGADILEYIRQRTLKQPDLKEIAALIKQMGDEEFVVREKAFGALVGMGAGALAGLKESENDADIEVRKRVADLKNRIDTKALPTLHAAMARVLARQKPEGAADILMAYLPFASDPMVVDELCKTLGAVAVRNGQPEPVLVKALGSEIAIKRAAAGEALARAKVKEELPNVKKLLKDKDVSVRFRVCMALMPLQDRELVPVMIDLMGVMTPTDLWPIEEALIRLAGDKAPNVSLGNDVASRKKCRDEWFAWLEKNENTLDMSKLYRENIYLGYTLVVQQNQRIGAGVRNTGEVYELDTKKKIRWKFDVNTYPVDAQMVSSNRVLIAEYQGNRVTERDIKGEIKWDYQCGGNPFAVQRLANGNTFVAMQGRLVEVDRNKNEVWSYQRPNQDIQRARKLPNGEVILISNAGQCIRLDPRTKNVIKQFNVVAPGIIFGSMDVLPNGNVLVTQYGQQRVVEYDMKGGQVGNPIQIVQPNSVVRLPNGHVLVTSYGQRQIYEFNGNQQVWNFQTDGIVFVARRR